MQKDRFLGSYFRTALTLSYLFFWGINYNSPAQCEAVRPEHLISQKHPVKLNGTFPSGNCEIK